MKLRLLRSALLLAVSVALACVEPVGTDDSPCPCASNYVCCEELNVCRRDTYACQEALGESKANDIKPKWLGSFDHHAVTTTLTSAGASRSGSENKYLSANSIGGYEYELNLDCFVRIEFISETAFNILPFECGNPKYIFLRNSPDEYAYDSCRILMTYTGGSGSMTDAKSIRFTANGTYKVLDQGDYDVCLQGGTFQQVGGPRMLH